MLKERNQRCGNRNNLARRNVHELDFCWFLKLKLTFESARYEGINKLAVLVKLSVSLSNDVLPLFNCGQVDDLIADSTTVNFSIRRFHEPIFVGSSIERQ